MHWIPTDTPGMLPIQQRRVNAQEITVQILRLKSAEQWPWAQHSPARTQTATTCGYRQERPVETFRRPAAPIDVSALTRRGPAKHLASNASSAAMRAWCGAARHFPPRSHAGSWIAAAASARRQDGPRAGGAANGPRTRIGDLHGAGAESAWQCAGAANARESSGGAAFAGAEPPPRGAIRPPASQWRVPPPVPAGAAAARVRTAAASAAAPVGNVPVCARRRDSGFAPPPSAVRIIADSTRSRARAAELCLGRARLRRARQHCVLRLLDTSCTPRTGPESARTRQAAWGGGAGRSMRVASKCQVSRLAQHSRKQRARRAATCRRHAPGSSGADWEDAEAQCVELPARRTSSRPWAEPYSQRVHSPQSSGPQLKQILLKFSTMNDARRLYCSRRSGVGAATRWAEGWLPETELPSLSSYLTEYARMVQNIPMIWCSALLRRAVPYTRQRQWM